jgi:hypothetical protein
VKEKRPKPSVAKRDRPLDTLSIEAEGIELDADAWPKFEKLIRSAAKMGPKPHKPG